MEAKLSLPEELIDQIVDRLVGRLDEKIRPSLMDVDQLAAFLNVPRGWLYDRTRDKTSKFPCIRIGRYVRFDLPEVIEFLKGQE